MNTASRMGTRIGAAASGTVTTRAKAPATSRPRAGALNAWLDVMRCSPQTIRAIARWVSSKRLGWVEALRSKSSAMHFGEDKGDVSRSK